MPAAAATTSLATATAVVHLEYDLETPPPLPSADWTRFVCISDTHGQTCYVPPGDVLLHSGDLTEEGLLTEYRTTVEWLREQPHPTKMIIAGNHDFSLDHHNDWYHNTFRRWHEHEQDVESIRELLTGSESREAGLIYLENETYHFQARPNGRKWSIYGSPWTPELFNWAFGYKRDLEANRIVAHYPQVDILLTHGPPAGILDKTNSGETVGCASLTARLPSIRPRLHVFGHIHEDHGAVITKWDSISPQFAQGEATVHVNAANMPAGFRARLPEGGYATFGSRPFQPVIVDLLDTV